MCVGYPNNHSFSPTVAHGGRALASAWPPQAQFLPVGGRSRPGSCPWASSPGPELVPVGLSRPGFPSWPRPPAQLLPHNHVRPSSCPAPGSRCRPQASLRSGLPGPPSASRRPGETRLLPDNGLPWPSGGLTSASPGHVSAGLAADATASPATFRRVETR